MEKLKQKDEANGLKLKILDTAARLFITNGYHGFSMREIAEELGVTKPAIYYYFTDKDDLILAVLVNCLDEYKQLLDACIDCQSTCRQKLTRFVNAILQLSPEKRSIIQVAGQEIVHLSPDSRKSFNELYHNSFIDKISEIIYQGIENKEIRDMDPVLVTRIFLGMVSPFFHINENNSQKSSELILSIFFDGVIPHE